MPCNDSDEVRADQTRRIAAYLRAGRSKGWLLNWVAVLIERAYERGEL